MREPYQDIENWSLKQLEDELEALYTDKQAKIMTEKLYRECFDIILGEILRKTDKEDRDIAYDRAMKGI